MPTGITNNLHEKDVSFKDFVLNCAVLCSREIELPEYYIKNIAGAIRRFETIKRWDDEKWKNEAYSAYLKESRFRRKRIKKKRKILARHKRLLAQVKAWTPPGPDHVAFKERMIQQLETGIEFDCDLELKEPRQLSASEYKEREIAKARGEIEYYKMKYRQELEFFEKQARWFDLLRQSLY